MEIQISAEIHALLSEHETVVIPGLGAFFCAYQEALLDPYAEKLSPPSYKVRFDDDLQINDGILQDFLKQKYHLSTQQAQTLIAEFVSQVETALNMSETVTFEHIGQLYKDAYKKLQFVPAQENLNPDSFGLPSVYAQTLPRTQTTSQKGYPYARSVSDTNNARPTPTDEKEEKWTPPTEREPKPLPVETTKVPSAVGGMEETVWWQSLNIKDFVPSMVVITLLGIAGVIYFSQEEKSEKKQTSKAMKPPITGNDSGDNVSDTAVALHSAAIQSSTPSPQTDTQKNTEVAASTKICVVIVAAYKNQLSGAPVLRQVQEAGYQTFWGKRGEKFVFGCQFEYHSEAECNEHLQKVRTKFGKDAWILKK